MPENALRDMDENELASLAAAGNDEAMAMLIATVMPIAKAKAAGFAQVRISDEDLVQEGMLGFLEAVKKFDPSKGVPFKAYASVCIKNRMINAFNRNNSAANSPLTGAVPIDDEQLTDHASNPENITKRQILQRNMYTFLCIISLKRQPVYVLRNMRSSLPRARSGQMS